MVNSPMSLDSPVMNTPESIDFLVQLLSESELVYGLPKKLLLPNTAGSIQIRGVFTPWCTWHQQEFLQTNLVNRGRGGEYCIPGKLNRQIGIRILTTFKTLSNRF
jgi:hypothetical protein